MSTLRLEPARVGTLGSSRGPGPLVRLRPPARALRALADRHRPAHGVHEQRHRPAAAGLALHARPHLAGARRHRVRGLRDRRPSLAALVRMADLPVRDRPARRHARDRDRHRRRVALGLDLRAAVPVLGGREDPPGGGARALPRHARGLPREPADDRRGGLIALPLLALVLHPAGPGHVARVRRPSSSGRSSSSRREPALADRGPPRRPRVRPDRLELRPQGLPEGAPHLVPGPHGRPARFGLPAPAVPDRGRVRRPVRPGPHERHRPGRSTCRSSPPTSCSRAWARSSGFMGGALVLVLFALLIWRVLLVGWRSDDLFILAFSGGIAGMLLFQMVVNVGHGARRHAHHRHPAAVRDAWRRLAHQRGASAWASSRAWPCVAAAGPDAVPVPPTAWRPGPVAASVEDRFARNRLGANVLSACDVAGRRTPGGTSGRPACGKATRCSRGRTGPPD